METIKETRKEKENKVYNEYYSQLQGFKIESFEMVDSGDQYIRNFPSFILSKGKQKLLIEVSQDEEGNGGGFLFISDDKGKLL